MSAEQENLDALKALCLEDESPEDHAAHAEDLANAYAAFAGRQESNPATPGVETALEAGLVVQGAAGPDAGAEVAEVELVPPPSEED